MVILYISSRIPDFLSRILYFKQLVSIVIFFSCLILIICWINFDPGLSTFLSFGIEFVELVVGVLDNCCLLTIFLYLLIFPLSSLVWHVGFVNEFITFAIYWFSFRTFVLYLIDANVISNTCSFFMNLLHLFEPYMIYSVSLVVKNKPSNHWIYSYLLGYSRY